MARVSIDHFDEGSLPGIGAYEDVEGINALLAMERVTAANEAYRIEDVDEEFESTLHSIAVKQDA